MPQLRNGYPAPTAWVEEILDMKLRFIVDHLAGSANVTKAVELQNIIAASIPDGSKVADIIRAAASFIANLLMEDKAERLRSTTT